MKWGSKVLAFILAAGLLVLTRLYHFKNMKVTINQYFKVIYFKT